MKKIYIWNKVHSAIAETEEEAKQMVINRLYQKLSKQIDTRDDYWKTHTVQDYENKVKQEFKHRLDAEIPLIFNMGAINLKENK